MTKWITLIADIIAQVLISLIRKSGPIHSEGKSDGTTEKRLRDKVKKDGWNVK